MDISTAKRALELIKKHNVIVIHRHSNPDGDAIGSQAGLAEIIKTAYPKKKVYVVGDDPKRFSFVEGSAPQTIDDQTYNGALAIVLDTSAKFMISDNRYTLAAETLRFDHHIFCEPICDLDVIDTSYESCCGLIADFARQTDLPVNDKAATALFTGMVTDSGRFRYDSTTSQTYGLAAFLMSRKIDTTAIYAELYADDFKMIRLRAEFTLKIKFTPKNTAYIFTTKQEVAQYGVDANTISRAMVGTMSDIKGVDVWANFTETDNGVLCELRSQKYNVNPVATKYGGGGHAKASGATVANFDVAKQMLADLDELNKQSEEQL